MVMANDTLPVSSDGIYPRCVLCYFEIYGPDVMKYSHGYVPCRACHFRIPLTHRKGVIMKESQTGGIEANFVPAEVEVVETVKTPAKIVMELPVETAQALHALLGASYGEYGFAVAYTVLGTALRRAGARLQRFETTSRGYRVVERDSVRH